MLHTLRRVTVRFERDILKEKVKWTRPNIGGPEAGLKGGRHLLDKMLVMGTVEVRGKGSSRVGLHVGLEASTASLTGFVEENVECGTVFLTDG